MQSQSRRGVRLNRKRSLAAVNADEYQDPSSIASPSLASPPTSSPREGGESGTNSPSSIPMRQDRSSLRSSTVSSLRRRDTAYSIGLQSTRFSRGGSDIGLNTVGRNSSLIQGKAVSTHGGRADNFKSSLAPAGKSIHEGDSEEKGRMSTAIRTRDNSISQYVAFIVDSSIWKAGIFFFTLVALFALDFNNAFLPPSVDESTVWFVFSAFAFLLMDIVLNVIAKENFLFSFYFWLDLLGTLSIMLDVPFLLGDAVSSDQSEDVTVARASRVSRIARTTNLLRIAKFVRLVRVVNIFRCAKNDEEGEAEREVKPSLIVTTLNENLSKMTIVLVGVVY